MATVLENKFFISEIIDRKVFMKSTIEQLGRLNDMVIVETGKLPEVTHFVVNRPYGYPSLLLPLNKLTLISETEIVFDVNGPAEYERLPADGSILLRSHVLDKKILDMDGHEVEVVYDISLDYQGGKLYVSEVDISRRRLLRRMGLRKLADWLSVQRKEDTMISWMYVQQLPEHIDTFKGQVKLNVLKENIGEIHPVDLADILEELDGEQRIAVFNQIEPEQASETLEEVEPRVLRDLIRAMGKRHAAKLINARSPAQAAAILAVLPSAEADELLPLMNKESATKVQKIIDHHDENILLFSTQKFMKLPESIKVSEVLTNFREIAQNMDVIMYVYVTDVQDTLEGVVDLRELIAAEPDQLLGEVMTDNIISLNPEDNLSDAVDMFARYDFRAIPVTDAANKLMGIVSFKHIRGIEPRLD